MGKKFDLNFLKEEESTKILNVLENDFQLRMQERNRLGKLRKKISDEDKLAMVLSDQKDFNANCCIRCYKSFFVLFNPRFVCYACKFNVCKNCCSFFLQFRDFICKTCQKEKDVMAQSCDWFYETVQRRFRQSGSAKVARRLTQTSKKYRSLTTRQKVEYLLELLQAMDDPTSSADTAPGRGRTSVFDIFTSDKKKEQVLEHRSSSPSSQEDIEEEEEEVDEAKLRKAKAFQEAFPEVTVRPSATAENSQKEVLRRMKAVQITRFHERVHEAMTQIRSEIRASYPYGLPVIRDDFEFRQFIRKSREELTIILKNFSQILAITIESHNLALGRTSEDVQIDIQHILQDEVETVVSRRVDVHLDDTVSVMTDESSKISAAVSVEQRLAAVILRKVLDDFRSSCRRGYGADEEEALRELDRLIDEEEEEMEAYFSESRRRRGDGSRDSSRRLTGEVDPDILSLSRGAVGAGRSKGSSSHYSCGSSQWLLRGRPAGNISADSMSGLGRDVGPKVGGKSTDELSDLSSGSVEDTRHSSKMDSGTLWAGTSNEETKHELLKQLRQQDSGIGTHYDSSPPSSQAGSSALDSEYRARMNITGRPKSKRRIETLSRDMITANQNAAGAAAQMEANAEQMQGIMQQLNALDDYITDLNSQFTPSHALRQSSDQGVAVAARALRQGTVKPPVSKSAPLSPADRHRAQIEEDIYTKAAEMVDVYELIEQLEGALLRDPGHSEGEECPQHVQRWCSIEEHVVSTVERLEGDLRDVDDISKRVSSRSSADARRVPGFNFNSERRQEQLPRRGEKEVTEPYHSTSSNVTFGTHGVGSSESQRQSRDAWDDYHNAS